MFFLGADMNGNSDSNVPLWKKYKHLTLAYELQQRLRGVVHPKRPISHYLLPLIT